MNKLLSKTLAVILLISFTGVIAFCESRLNLKNQHSTCLQLQKPVYYSSRNTEPAKQETGLRRFEIIFLTTLPLTLFISFTGVQVYEMNQQKTTSPTLDKDNLKLVFSISLTASTLIAVKDLIKWKKAQKENDKEEQTK